MKHKILFAAIFVLAVIAKVHAAVPDLQFSPEASLATVVEVMPGNLYQIPWLGEVHAKRMEKPIEDNTMPSTREVFERWCKAKGANILQPRRNNCVPLNGGYLGCAVGELLRFGESDIKVGLRQLAKNNNSAFQSGWRNASWIISNNVVGAILFNSKEKSIVGELQRCVRSDNSIVAAMIYASIDSSDYLLFLTDERLSEISGIGKQSKIEMLEKAAEKKRAQLDALKPGDTVILKEDIASRGMVIEMPPPLAQIQWKTRFESGIKVEWVRIDELDIPPNR